MIRRKNQPRSAVRRTSGHPGVPARRRVTSPANPYDLYESNYWSHRGLWVALVISAGLHAAIILVPAAPYKPRIMELPPLCEVSLVRPEPVRQVPQEQPKEPEKKPVVPKKEEPPKVVTPEVKPKKVVTPQPKPKKEPEVKQPKVVEKPPEEKEQEQPPAPVAQVSATVTIAGDLPRWYVEAIQQVVYRNWDEPILTTDTAIETMIYCTILRSGEVASPRIEKESGDRRWDLTALRAVMQSKFPPLPPEYKDATLPVHFQFRSKQTTIGQ